MPRKRTADTTTSEAPSDQADAKPGATNPTPIGTDEPAEQQAPPLHELFALDPSSTGDSQLQDIANRHIQATLAKSDVAADYTVLFLHDALPIGRGDADRIYRAIESADRSKAILLIINSPGGDVASAYLIAKLCRETTDARFEVAIPRQAKSAATLITCGADRIHMGSLSELGPIDPQFGQIPALALKNSVEHLAGLSEQHPAAAEMFASYLARSLRVEALGYYERVAESASQYAVRLLNKRRIAADREPEEVARRLVYDYKDHGFVIDAMEAAEIFGENVVVTNTPEYQLANLVYGQLNFMEWIYERTFAREFSFTGGPFNGCYVFAKVE